MKRIIEKLKFDTVVIGGGVAGICAAVAAARHGCTVALICDRPVLGGNASSEVGVNINGAAYNALYSPSVYARETGIVEELKQMIFAYDGCRANRMAGYDAAFFELVYSQKNLTVFLYTTAQDVKTAKGKITEVLCYQIFSERIFEISGDIFVDATGDGLPGALAGAEFMRGSEGKDEFGETLAPPKKTKYTNGGTLMFYSRDTGKPVKYTRPDFAHDITKLPFFKGIGTKHRKIFRADDGNFYGLWWVEYGGHLDTITDNEDIVLELRKLVYGFWDYIKNGGEFDKTENLILERVCPVIGKRESRRFVGDYILSQNDLVTKKEFADAAFMGGWPMDVHADYGIYDDDYATHWNFVPGMYNAPFRCLYSKNVPNLMFAGRNISATRVANGSARVIGTCAAEGQAVGTAAALCKKYSLAPREVGSKKIGELQTQLIKDDQTLMGYKENFDLKNLKIETSSQKALDNPCFDKTRVLDKALCLGLPLEKELKSYKIKVKNNSNVEQQLTYRILTGTLPECYMPDREVAGRVIKVAAAFAGLVTIDMGIDVGTDGKLYTVFEANPSLAVYVSEHEVTGAPSFTLWQKEPDGRDPRTFVLTRIYDNIGFTDVTPQQNLYVGCNVFSGYSRPHKTPNLWISGGTDNEYLAATFEPRHASEIRLVFNTDLAEDIIRRQCKKTIKDYRLEITHDKGVEVVTITDNFRRMNTFAVDKKISGVKFVPLSNYGAPNFELFSIKIY